MSGTEYVSHVASGNSPFIGIPVFASRVFRHSFIVINRKSGVKKPKDLEGRRVGVQLYTMSAAMWIRGMLQHDHGVDLSTISWVQGAIDGPGSHGSPSVLPLLKQPNVVNNDSDKSLSQMLEDGEIDAILSAMMPESFGRNPDIVRLFPNFREVEADYYRRTKLFPLMHLVVIRRDIYDTNPEVAQSLYDAFCRAKDISLEHMKYTGALRYMLPFLPADLDEIEDVFDGDPWPYGIETNRPTLEAEVQYMVEQHYIAKAMPIGELFAPGVG